jgi:hypothetical protein
MINSKHSARAGCLLVVLSWALTAQEARVAVPLKNWSSPLYWHPNQAEREATTTLSPQLQFSTNQVSTDALTFVAITPCRLVDTRGAGGGFNGNSPFSGPSIVAAGTGTFPVQNSGTDGNTEPAPCGTIPSIAEAYSFNLTVVPHTNTAGGVVGFVTMWPAGATRPVVATLTDGEALIVSNAAIVPAGTLNGGVSVYNSGPATIDVVIDVNGFFAAPTDLNSNTAVGAGTLLANTTGSYNTANGAGALYSNTTGNDNAAFGSAALLDNEAGYQNTASGQGAMKSNTAGHNNSATGQGAMYFNTTGNGNTASGQEALYYNTTGNANTANGKSALLNNTGSNNTAAGETALQNNTTGNDNIAIGEASANNAPVGNSNSIYIGSGGSASDAAGTIQIGTQGTQTGGTFIAGIYGANAPEGTEVYVNSHGQLGTVPPVSSGRFKEQITDMGDRSSKLFQLRPVNFIYKPGYDDGSHALQYGLIAEEVAKVYPEMVIYGKDGQPLSVRYQLLAPMLLNEVQKQAEHIRALEDQAEQNRQQAEQNRVVERRLSALEALLSGATEPVR